MPKKKIDFPGHDLGLSYDLRSTSLGVSKLVNAIPEDIIEWEVDWVNVC